MAMAMRICVNLPSCRVHNRQFHWSRLPTALPGIIGMFMIMVVFMVMLMVVFMMMFIVMFMMMFMVVVMVLFVVVLTMMLMVTVK